MVGPSHNPHTLVNYLVNAILEQKPIQLHKNACRNLLDIDDLVGLLNPYLADEFVQLQINIPGSEKTTIPDLVNKIENILHTHGNYTWLDIGACYDIPVASGECVFVHDHQYVEKILIKYFSNRKSNS
jgi:nucleoside-diphosphate-sugar epimerase